MSTFNVCYFIVILHYSISDENSVILQLQLVGMFAVIVAAKFEFEDSQEVTNKTNWGMTQMSVCTHTRSTEKGIIRQVSALGVQGL